MAKLLGSLEERHHVQCVSSARIVAVRAEPRQSVSFLISRGNLPYHPLHSRNPARGSRVESLAGTLGYDNRYAIDSQGRSGGIGIF